MAAMEFDMLLDSLIQQRKAPEVSKLEGKYAEILKLQQIPSKGEGVFAQRFFSVKNPICDLSYPTIAAIDSDFLPTTCYYCFALTASPSSLPNYGCESISLRICNGCQRARFCDQNCQLQAWMQFHKYECKIFKKTQLTLLPATIRAVMRAVLLKDRDLMREEEWGRIAGLTSHEHILAGRGRSNLTEMAEVIKSLTGSNMGVETIQRLIFIMRSNAVELPTRINGRIGVMLDPLVGRINHSCEPNITIHRPQYTMTSGWKDSSQLSEKERQAFVYIIPLRDIQEGEELLNCYIVPTTSVKDRKTKFMDNYFFDCTCSICVSDTEEAARFIHEKPDLTTRFQQWSKDMKRNISRISVDSRAFRKAATAMNKSEQFLEYPILYTTDDFPQMAMGLILEGLKAQAFEEAFINALRLYFLVNPERFVGRHNPTNIYTMFLMLSILDRILETSSTSETTPDKKKKQPRNISIRRFSPHVLTYWQRRLRTDLRTRLEGSAMKDLLCLLPRESEDDPNPIAQNQARKRDESKETAEQEMRAVLKMSETRWRTVLEKAGC